MRSGADSPAHFQGTGMQWARSRPGQCGAEGGRRRGGGGGGARSDRAGDAVAAAPGGEAHARYVCEFGESCGAAVGRPRRARSASGWVGLVVWSCAFAARGVRSANVGLCVEAQQSATHAVSTGPPRSASRVAPFALVLCASLGFFWGGVVFCCSLLGSKTSLSRYREIVKLLSLRWFGNLEHLE